MIKKLELCMLCSKEMCRLNRVSWRPTVPGNEKEQIRQSMFDILKALHRIGSMRNGGEFLTG